jgi:chromosome segregation ATPase
MGPHKVVTTISPKKVKRDTIRTLTRRNEILHDTNQNLLFKDYDNELKIAELECEVEGNKSMLEYLNERIEELKTELKYQRNKREQAEVELDTFYK